MRIPLIKALKIQSPPLHEQRAIAHVLGSLDDKIELNREMNRTLEELARTVFKAWFVDFEGQTEFDEIDGRRVPRGWRVGRLGDVANFSGGKQLKDGHLSDEGRYPVYGANGIMGFTNDFNTDGLVIVIGRVGANCGSIKWTYGQAWINNNGTLIKPLFFDEYVLALILNEDFFSLRKGSAQPFISNSDMSSKEVLLPSKDLMERFNNFSAPLFSKIHANNEQSRTLRELRDTLLPKLISGELRVRDAERFL